MSAGWVSAVVKEVTTGMKVTAGMKVPSGMKSSAGAEEDVSAGMEKVSAAVGITAGVDKPHLDVSRHPPGVKCFPGVYNLPPCMGKVPPGVYDPPLDV